MAAGRPRRRLFPFTREGTLRKEVRGNGTPGERVKQGVVDFSQCRPVYVRFVNDILLCRPTEIEIKGMRRKSGFLKTDVSDFVLALAILDDSIPQVYVHVLTS